MSEYETVSRGALKLKVDTEFKKKKKKKKEKESQKMFQGVSNAGKEETSPEKKVVIPLTKAQKAFLKMQEKRQMERIMEKASKTHKQRVEEFNRNLDALTEHYDIPKVSWTK